MKRYQLVGPPVEAVKFGRDKQTLVRINVFAGHKITIAEDATHIETKHGAGPIEPGDWIVRNAVGEIYVVRAADFAKYYHPVTELPAPRRRKQESATHAEI